MKLKICNNLHLIDGKIISYSTVVGRVTQTSIETNGKYSRTTTKHVGRISQLLGIPIEYTTMKKQWFAQYELGVNIEFDEAIDQSSSLKILAKIKETGSNLLNAAILALPELKGKRKQRCIDQLLNNGIDRQRIYDTLELARFGLV